MKTDITTTIDSTSTDTQVPSAKALYNKTKNMCTTSVADVAFTKLTLDSSIFTLASDSESYFSYTVCNGMCTITWKGIGLVSVGSYVVTSNIPKPVGGYASNILQVSKGSNVPTTPIFLVSNDDGVTIMSNSHTGPFWGTLTYPVAES